MKAGTSGVGGLTGAPGGEEEERWVEVAGRWVVGHHDVVSLAAFFGLAAQAQAGSSLEPARVPTGASGAGGGGSSGDPGDAKGNELLAPCPAFRNELGGEPVARLGLARETTSTSAHAQAQAQALNPRETWLREAGAAEAGVLENLGLVYLGGRLCARRLEQAVLEQSDAGAFYYRHCFSGRSAAPPASLHASQLQLIHGPHFRPLQLCGD